MAFIWARVQQAFLFDRDVVRFLIVAVVLMASWQLSLIVIQSMAVDPVNWIQSELPMLALFFRNPFHIVVVLAFSVLLILNYSQFDKNSLYGQVGWGNEMVLGARWAVSIVCFSLAYYYLSADVNLFAGQPYVVDRLILVILAGLVFVNPAFVPMFAIYGYSFNLQYSVPLGHTDIHHLNVLFEFLTLFSLYTAFKVVIGNRVNFMHVMLLTVVRVASSYVYSAFGKLVFIDGPIMAWLTQNHISYMAAGAYIANDWLAFLPEAWSLQLLSMLGRIELLLVIYTIVAELAIIFVFLWNRKLSAVLLGMIILLHFGIYVFTGVLFRAWLLLAVTCLVILLIQPNDSDDMRCLYRPPVTAFSIVLILLAPWLLTNLRMFAWWDTNVYPVFDYEVVTTTGERYPLERDFLRQIEDLHRGRTWTLVDQITPGSNSWGGLIGWKYDYPSYAFFAAATDVSGPEEIPSVIETYGSNRYDSDEYEQFEILIYEAFTHYNERKQKKRLLPVPQLPLNFNTGRDPNTEYYAGLAPIESVKVVYRVFYYHPSENRFHTIQEQTLYQIKIDGDSE